MKKRTGIALCTAVVLAWAGCNTTASRIRKQQAVFDSYPEQVQHNLRRGSIEVGYTPEMVLIALGEPDRRVDVVTGEVAAQVWTWWKSSPGIRLGLGSATSVGSHVGLGSGVMLGERPQREETAVVEFRSSRVHRFEMLAPR